jgi:hypothetical protein
VIEVDMRKKSPHAAWNPVGEPASRAEAVPSRFKELARQWRKATGHLSLASRMAAHPAYEEIVDMGWAAVPLLLDELRRKPDHWFIALERITGENPVAKADEGDVKKMAKAWVKWGEFEGHAP